MNKISVLIPTLQKNIEVFYKLLNILKQDEAVNEILIINNALQDFPNFVPDAKIKIFTPSENLYVNTSWNLGVMLLEKDKFLIINDDILCCENFCSMVIESKILDQESTGLVGLNGSYINQYDKNFTTDISVPELNPQSKLSFLELDKYIHTGDWGSAFFGKKENYYEIPSNLKIIYGDNYLLRQNLQNGKINYQLGGIPFNHIHSLSSGAPEFTNIIVSDIQNSEKYF